VGAVRLTGRVAAAGIALCATSCWSSWIVVQGPVTQIEDGRICVDTSATVPGGGCTDYTSPEEVAGVSVGDCVRMELYAESARIHEIRKTTGCTVRS
jgi:hypothetical protein